MQDIGHFRGVRGVFLILCRDDLSGPFLEGEILGKLLLIPLRFKNG